MKVDLKDLIGKPVEAAAKTVTDTGMRMRVTSEDGKTRMGTCDFRMDRVNVSVVKGKVTSANLG